MNYKYLQYTLKGEKSITEAQAALGEQGSQGVIVRLDTGGGQTKITLAVPDTGAKPASGGAKKGGLDVKEVSEDDVTKVG